MDATSGFKLSKKTLSSFKSAEARPAPGAYTTYSGECQTAWVHTSTCPMACTISCSRCCPTE